MLLEELMVRVVFNDIFGLQIRQYATSFSSSLLDLPPSA
jgi:hypothetical protein